MKMCGRHGWICFCPLLVSAAVPFSCVLVICGGRFIMLGCIMLHMDVLLSMCYDSRSTENNPICYTWYKLLTCYISLLVLK